MNPLFTDIANNIYDSKQFSQELLAGINLYGNKYDAFKVLQANIGKKIIFFEKGIVFADKKENLRKEAGLREDELKRLFNDTYIKILHNKYDHIRLDNDRYVIDFNMIIDKVSMLDHEVVIPEIIDNIYQENIIYVINEMNKINKLRAIYPKSVFEFLESLYELKVSILIKKYLYIVATVIVLLLTLYLYYKGFIITKNNFSSEQTVALSLVGTIATITGFAVVFLQLSFDNFKKYYGLYAKEILFKSLGRSIIILLAVSIFSGVISAISNENYFNIVDKKIYYQDIFFISNVISFFSFLILLFYKIKTIFNYSLSYAELQNTINHINLRDTKEIYKNMIKKDNSEIMLRRIENNSIETVIEVIVNYLNQGNYQIVEILIRDMTTKFKDLALESQYNKSYVSLNEIVIVYCKTIETIFSAYRQKNSGNLMEYFYKSCIDFNSTIAAMKCDVNSLSSIFTLIDIFLRISVDKGTKIEKYEAFKSLESVIFKHLSCNFPPQYDFQTGSPSISGRRYMIYRSAADFKNKLLHYSAVVMYDNLSEIIENKEMNYENGYAFLSIYKEFTAKVIGIFRSVGFKHMLTKKLLDNSVNISKNLFPKVPHGEINFHSYGADINGYSPIDPILLESTVVYGNYDIGELIIAGYKSWCLYVMSSEVNNGFLSVLVRESVGILLGMIRRIQKNLNTNIEERAKINTLYYLEKSAISILSIYYDFDYTFGSDKIFIPETVRSNFSGLKNYTLNDANFYSGANFYSVEFLSKIDFLVNVKTHACI